MVFRAGRASAWAMRTLRRAFSAARSAAGSGIWGRARGSNPGSRSLGVGGELLADSIGRVEELVTCSIGRGRSANLGGGWICYPAYFAIISLMKLGGGQFFGIGAAE